MGKTNIVIEDDLVDECQKVTARHMRLRICD